jgi:uncharacterized surface protein with fasciclin (FAS1) repeats/predicted lipoprotein with Yx(FWY)xxD motif
MSNGVWFVARPDYSIMLANNQLVGNNGVNYRGDYTEGDEVIQYFTDANGVTLYTWVNDHFNKNKFTSENFGNNAAWPIYEADGMVVPSSINGDDFTFIDVHGRSQLAYRGWPLYYFGQDAGIRGETKGVSVPQPGIWPVAVSGMASPSYETVVDIIVGSEVHTTLATAVTEANLVGALSGEGPFTVFAPTNAAFAALPEGTLEALLADAEGALTDILLYHVVPGRALSTDLSDGQTLTTLLGEDLTVSITEAGVFINGAEVTIANLEAENGVVHVINAVLVPATEEPLPATVVDIIVGSEVHTTLATAVTEANLVGALSGEGPFTVFAPTNAAFAALPEGTLEALLADAEGALTDILLYHVVSGRALSTDLSDGQTLTTLLGEALTVSITEAGVFINGAEVTIANLEAENGVVHVINAVLVPATEEPLPATVVDIIVGSEVHTTLATAVTEANLVGALSGEGPFTVFAPTNEAFAALPEGTLEALLADAEGALTDILLYHVVSGRALSTDLSDGQTLTTLLGEDLTVSITEAGVFINGAEVTIANLEAENGVVHVINAVLVPATEEPLPATVVDIIVGSEVHTTLATAVTEANLVGALSGEGPFTVFAPTNAAFAALPEGTLEALLADAEGALTDILLYHVVSGRALSTDLSDGQTLTTLLGEALTVSITEAGVFINGAEVTIANLEAENGVVHVINAVLVPATEEPLPATVVDIIVGSEVHTTLATAVTEANLVGALSGEGPFTVFAPTNEAFAALPEGTLEALLADAEGALTDILLYHVVSGRALSTDLSDGQTLTTLLGEALTVSITEAGVFINGAEVTIANLEAENGVVHVINAVLVPAAEEGDVLVLNVKMAVWADYYDKFDPEADFVDVAGDFNDWAPEEGSFRLTALNDEDMTYTITITDLEVGAEYGFKFRINGSWDNEFHEFPAGGPDRKLTMQEGRNEYTYWFNDEDRTTNFNAPGLPTLKVYPNPVRDILSIDSDSTIREIRLVSMIGQVVYAQTVVNSNNIQINVNQFEKGIYLLQVDTADGVSVERVIIGR